MYVNDSSDYILEMLRKHEVEYVFGVPGSYIAPLWQKFCDNCNIKIVLAKNEAHAVYLADGYTRSSKKIGVVLSTTGPGVTNMITGIASAFKDSIPIIVISGQSDPQNFKKGDFQESIKFERSSPNFEMVSHVTKKSYEIYTVDDLLKNFNEGISKAIEGRKGPVFFSISVSVQKMKIPVNEKINVAKNINFVIDREKVYKTADICNKEFKRPVILVGWGVYLSDAFEELNSLSSKMKCPIISTVKGRSAIGSSNNYYWGHIGPAENKKMIKALEEYQPDSLIVLGCSLSSYYMNSISYMVQNLPKIRFDIDFNEIRNFCRNDYNIEGEFKTTIKIFSELIVERIKIYKDYENVDVLVVDKGAMKSKDIISSLNDLLNENTILFPDAGNHWLDALYLFKQRKENNYMTNSGHAQMGHAISAAIGFKLGNSKKDVIVLTGDGSMLMAGNEIHTCAEYGIKVIFIVINNKSLGRVRTAQTLEFNKSYIGSDLNYTNFKQYSLSLGVDAQRVENVESFINVFKKAKNSKKSFLIEVLSDKEEFPSCFIEEEV